MRTFDQSRALSDEPVRAFGTRIEWRTWNGEDFPALLEREIRGDQRAGTFRSFDDNNAAR